MLKVMKALFIVPQIGFNDVELTTIRDKLTNNRFICEIASYSNGTIISKTGLKLKAERLIAHLNADEYDCFIFVGGENVYSLSEYPQIIELIKDANKKDKILAILCVNPILLLKKAELLAGRKVTVFHTKNGWSKRAVTENQGILVDEPVVIDGNVITCRDEWDALQLSESIIEEFKRRRQEKKKKKYQKYLEGKTANK